MPDPIHLKKLYPAEIYSEIIDKVKDWDVSQPLTGVGCYKKIESFGHIEVSISPSDFYTDTLVWGIAPGDIPQGYLLQQITDQFSFFSNFLTSVKGRHPKSLVFEVTDITYHVTDSWRFAFSYATAYALRNCFDKAFNKLTQADSDYIARVKRDTLTSNKTRACTFTQEQIINSLKDTGLNTVIRDIVKGINPLMLDFNISSFYTNRAALTDLFLRNVSAESMGNLKTVNIISAYDELTDIGVAHMGLILKKASVFNSLNLKDLSPLYGYYDIGFIK